MASQYRHMFVVMGPAGCGKSTVAEVIASSLQVPCLDGDEYHPPSNIQKMSNGISLTDHDRWDWLILLRRTALQQLCPPSSFHSIVLSCSALKEKYRDVLRVAALENPHVLVHFIYLHADVSVLEKRVGARQGHYMKGGMVRAQLEALERPSGREVERDTVVVDVAGSRERVVGETLGLVGGIMGEY
ncbi:hypothetical protein MMC12_005987 [Toensbergia leucococca]|nr:hypothetical protein [Toensbergia leucococca]